MLHLVGYQLLNKNTDEVIEQWGGTPGIMVDVPTFLMLPNGDQVCAPTLNAEYGDYKFVEWYMEAPEPRPAFAPISDRQFFQQAALNGIITEQEAIDAVRTGAIPSILQTIIDTIQDPVQKFAAIMIVSGATAFERNHPMVEQIGSALGMTEAQIDQFFLDASLL